MYKLYVTFSNLSKEDGDTCQGPEHENVEMSYISTNAFIYK